MAIYGYARVSTPKQNIERQIRNIWRAAPEAEIFQDKYTGMVRAGRKDWLRLMNKVKPGDSIYFDAVARMSRNAEEGFADYEKLYNMGVHLYFIKDPHINTSVYRQALEQKISMTGTLTDIILEAVNRYIMEVAKQQIRVAFEASEGEVVRLRQRTSEGMQTAKLHGKQIGQKPGRKLTTQKSKEKKADIVRLSRDFDGQFSDPDCIRYLKIAANTYYKYKRELREELFMEEDGSQCDTI